LDDGLNVLHLPNVDHSQSGEVKCRVVCRDNRKIFNVYHTSLTVLPLPVNQRYEAIENFVENCSNKSSLVHDLTAYITKPPDDQTVLVGDSIQLDVEYYGVPEPTVKWMRAVSVSNCLFFSFCSTGRCYSTKNAQIPLARRSTRSRRVHLCFTMQNKSSTSMFAILDGTAKKFFSAVQLKKHKTEKVNTTRLSCASLYHLTLFSVVYPME
jgi:hypothetical protein